MSLVSNIKISKYKNIFDTEGIETSVYDFINGVKIGTWQDDVLLLRTLKDEKEFEKKKKSMPNVTLSGSFTKRLNKDIRKHSGFIAIDIDNVENPNLTKEVVKDDPYLFSAFISVSGKGLCLVFKIDGNKHLEAFEGLADYLYNKYGLISDQSCKNVSRARFVSYDPHLIINEESLLFKIYPKKQRKRTVDKIVFVESDFSEIISEFVHRGINICEDYKEWVSICFAIISEFGDTSTGREYFHALSSISSKYDFKDADNQYTSCYKNYSEGKKKVSTINSIYWHAKQNGIDTYSKKTKDVIRSAASKHKHGASKESIISELERYEDIEPEFSIPIVEQVIKNDIKHNSDNIIDDIESFLKPYELKRNLITRNIEWNGKVLDDIALNSIFIDCKASFDKASKDLVASVIFSNRTYQYNPIKDFLSSRDHDENLAKTPNLNKLLDCIETDTPNYRKWVTKWLVSIIASANGDYSPLLLVFSGSRQGSGKCLAKGTKVLMADGSVKKVENIVVGDKLMGIDGTDRNVLSLGRGRENMYKITQNKGIEYIVNESHILSLRNRDNHKTINVNVKDYVNGNVNRKDRLVGYRGLNENKIDSNLNIDPYFLGLWLGDGQSSLTATRIETKDEEIINYLHKFAKSINHKVSVYRQKGSQSNSYGIVKSKGSGFGFKNNPNHIKWIMTNEGLDNNKHIPLAYKTSSVNQRLELLAGIIDSDGSVSGAKNYEITQKSKVLIEDIAYISRSLGFRATITEKIVNKTTYYRLHLGGDVQTIPVKIKRKKITGKNFYNVMYTGIRSVEMIGVGDYYGFEIDGDNLFMLEDFTVTHNTHFFRYLLPQKLRYLFAESKMDNGKDDEILMTKKLIILDDEYGGKSKREEKHLKNITSKEFINVREPYGRISVDLRRLAVFCGTSNDHQILSDPTGNRRILPINIISLNHELYNSCNKEELLHELNYLYNSGYDFTVLREEIEQLNDGSQMFNVSSPEEELLSIHFQPTKNEMLGEWLTATEVIKTITADTKYVFSNVRLGLILNKFGYIKKRIRRGGSVVTAYLVKKQDNSYGGDEAPF